MDALATAARVVHVLLLSVWLGASVFYTLMAPKAERILDSRQLSADLLGSALGTLDRYGVFAGPVILLTLLVGWLPLRSPLRGRAGAALLMTGIVGVSWRFITPRLEEARMALGRPLQDLDAGDVLVREYERLHSLSTGMLASHAVLALILIVLAVRTAQPKHRSGIQL